MHHHLSSPVEGFAAFFPDREEEKNKKAALDIFEQVSGLQKCLDGNFDVEFYTFSVLAFCF